VGKASIPPPAKLVIAVLANSLDLLALGKEELQSVYGPPDLEGQPFKFTHTDHYQPEMGLDLLKQLLSFQRLIPKDALAEIKLKTNQLEIKLAECKPQQKLYKRKVNLDPGYLTGSKFVLATTKNYSHRIYLKAGIFAEVTLRYFRAKGQMSAGWEPYPWTYPDYREEHLRRFLQQVRTIYLAQIRH